MWQPWGEDDRWRQLRGPPAAAPSQYWGVGGEAFDLEQLPTTYTNKRAILGSQRGGVWGGGSHHGKYLTLWGKASWRGSWQVTTVLQTITLDGVKGVFYVSDHRTHLHFTTKTTKTCDCFLCHMQPELKLLVSSEVQTLPTVGYNWGPSLHISSHCIQCFSLLHLGKEEHMVPNSVMFQTSLRH